MLIHWKGLGTENINGTQKEHGLIQKGNSEKQNICTKVILNKINIKINLYHVQFCVYIKQSSTVQLVVLRRKTSTHIL